MASSSTFPSPGTTPSPDVAPLPAHQRKIAITPVRDDGHDASALARADRLLGELEGGEDVGARRVPDVQALLASHAVGHVPAVLGLDRKDAIGNRAVEYGGNDTGRERLKPLDALKRDGGPRRH